jgi:hypothetical protein
VGGFDCGRRHNDAPGGAGKKLTARVTFDIKYGERAKWLIRAATDAGQPIPDDAIPPDLMEECEFVYRAFNDLSADRAVALGVGPIPWSSINAYAQRYGIDDSDEFDRFYLLIRALDAAYLNIDKKS